MFDVRPLTEADIPAAIEVGMTAYHMRRREDDELQRLRWFLSSARLVGAFDGDLLAGVAGELDRELSIPGGALPCGAVTWVAVLPTHRRRGALGAMIERLFADARERGVPLQTLWAAEGTIYGRFGYGVAIGALELEIDARAPLELRVEPDPSPLRLVAEADAPEVLAPIHARERDRRPGLLDRSPDWWREQILGDGVEGGEGLGPTRVAVLGDEPRGYVVYRTRAGHHENAELELVELMADDTPAAAALWRYLTSIDLSHRVKARNRPVDDPLPLLVADGDRLTKTVYDGYWLRLLDLPAALQGRAAAADFALTLGVRDRLLPANDGSWRLEPGRCERTDAPPDLELDVRDLAAAYLGGTPVAALCRAGLATERMPGAAAALDAAWGTPLAPHGPDDY